MRSTLTIWVEISAMLTACASVRCRLKQNRPKVFEDFLGDETNPTQAYESYLKLVEQYMWTFAALCVPHVHKGRQFEPMMRVDDAWKWLALAVNACERYVTALLFF